jgi:hypothetical protein
MLNNMNIIYSKYFLLSHFDDDRMLLYKNYSFYIGHEGERKKILTIKTNILNNVFVRIRLLNRIFRLTPITTTRLGNIFIISFNKKLYALDILNKTIEEIFRCRDGFSSVLNICKIGNVLLFGDYGSNSKREDVNIYQIDSTLQVSIIYSFQANQIRHVHNIVYDYYNNSIIILTGDTEKASGIYIADMHFRQVKPLLVNGTQEYRSVVAFPLKYGLLYATDAVEYNNYIYYYQYATKQLIWICDLNGSCINGTIKKDYAYFSTTVESKEGSGLFSYNLGKGIKSKQVDIISVNLNTLQSQIICSFNKDIFPMKLCQYGLVKFPYDENQINNKLFITPIAVKKYDGKTLRIALKI